MIREHVVITPVNITLAGQVKHFQVKLPKNAKRIIGVELGGRVLSTSDKLVPSDGVKYVILEPPVKEVRIEGSDIRRSGFFRRNKLIGELKLQSCEEANIFYAGDLMTDENIAMGDFSQSPFWNPSVFTHQANSFEERVIVDGESTMIQGIYRDRLGEQGKTNYNYVVNVYVWIEIEEPTLNK